MSRDGSPDFSAHPKHGNIFWGRSAALVLGHSQQPAQQGVEWLEKHRDAIERSVGRDPLVAFVLAVASMGSEVLEQPRVRQLRVALLFVFLSAARRLPLRHVLSFRVGRCNKVTIVPRAAAASAPAAALAEKQRYF